MCPQPRKEALRVDFALSDPQEIEAMDQRGARRIEFLRQQIEDLTAQKKELMILADFSRGAEARKKWAERLDSTIERLRKHINELAALEQESS